MSNSRRQWIRNVSLATIGLTSVNKLPARDRIEDWWMDETESDWVRIGSNENPYGPGELAAKEMAKAIRASNRYPREISSQLRRALGERFGLDESFVLTGAGSSELLGVVAAYAATKPGNAVAAHPTFRLWFSAAERMGLSIKSVPCTADKYHDLPAMKNAMDDNTRMVYVVNPHNPTGTVLDDAKLRAFVAEASQRAVVLMDEAYTEYSDATTLADMVRNNPNVIVAKTFSKIYGLAGARVGYVLAHPDVVGKLSEYMPWANAGPSAVSLAGALAALNDQDFVKMTRTKTDATRAMIASAFKQMSVPITNSSTSFLYYDCSALKQSIDKRSEENYISGVRTFESNTKWRRTSIGTMDEMKKFLKVVQGCLG